MESIHFKFNEITSASMGQYSIRINGGGVESPFFGGQEIIELQKNDRITPFHFGTKNSPIEFTIEISPLDEEWTPERRREIGKWLIHDTYKPFQTADDLSKFYYAIVTSAPNFELYSNKGFVPFTFRTNSAYAWSPIYVEDYLITENVDGDKIIKINNRSNINKKYYPIIEVALLNDTTDFELINLSNGKQSFKFTDLHQNEIVSIDNENELIVSNLPFSKPFEGFNRKWLELVEGINYIKVLGECEIRTKMQFPILQ